MKKLFIILALVLVPAVSLCFAGEVITTPQYIVTGAPTTNQVEKIRLCFDYGSPTTGSLLLNILEGAEVIKQLEIPITEENMATLMSGIGATLDSRVEVVAWTYIQANYTTQPAP